MSGTNYYLNREIEKARAKHKPITITVPEVKPEGNQAVHYKERIVEIPAPQLWDDDTTIAAQYNPVKASRTLIGEEGYEHWKAAGGTAAILMEIIRDSAGAASLGESAGS